jgi:choloylglycine hydrolase
MMPPAQPVSWTAQYGSFTISQIGKEYPNGGINEAGLVVEQTTLWQTQYPALDERPALGELQFIQYLLDTCCTVQEALAAATVVRIDQSISSLHYLLADRNGDQVILEFLDGRLIVHNGKLSIPIIANTIYEEAILEILRESNSWEDRSGSERNSIDRFRIVYEALNALEKQTPDMDFAFMALAAARREDTVYSLVYDLNQLELEVITQRNQERIQIRLEAFDFSVEAPAQTADLQKLQANHVRDQFVNYSADFNLLAVQSFFRDPILTSVFQWEISDEMIQFVANYPDSFLLNE